MIDLKQKLIESFDDDIRAKSLYQIMKSDGRINIPPQSIPKTSKTLSSVQFLRRQA